MRKELFAAVWPAVAVSDASVGKVIFELRDVLGDDSNTLESPRLVNSSSLRK
jgi:DNA-binding winged helix-turn-helix (wHTH) protein